MKNISCLIDYHIWATNKVRAQLKEITNEEWENELGGSFPSLLLVCKHLLQADYRWLSRWHGQPMAAIPETLNVHSVEELVDAWQAILEDMKTTLYTIYADDMERPLTFITAKGAKHTLPFWQTLYQVVNHGTYHRGQITNMLRMLGKVPVGTDMFLFFVEEGVGE